MDGLEFVAATKADSDRLSDIMLGEPGQLTTDVGMRLFGITDHGKAQRLWRVINRTGEAWRHVTLAKSQNETVGILMTQPLDVSLSASLLFRSLLMFGPLWLLRLPGRMRLQRSVNTERPTGAFRVSELHVAPSARGGGIGAALLVEAEGQARAGGHDTMTLQVLTENPALHLYERFGFSITHTQTNADYEALTRVSGYHRMVKRLA